MVNKTARREFDNRRVLDRRVKRQSEKSFMQTIISLARLCGWLVHHAYDSRKSAPGLPDLLLVRGEQVIFAELKVGNNRVTDAQLQWLGAIRRAHVDARLWTPNDWPEIESTLMLTREQALEFVQVEQSQVSARTIPPVPSFTRAIITDRHWYSSLWDFKIYHKCPTDGEQVFLEAICIDAIHIERLSHWCESIGIPVYECRLVKPQGREPTPLPVDEELSQEVDPEFSFGSE